MKTKIRLSCASGHIAERYEFDGSVNALEFCRECRLPLGLAMIPCPECGLECDCKHRRKIYTLQQILDMHQYIDAASLWDTVANLRETAIYLYGELEKKDEN